MVRGTRGKGERMRGAGDYKRGSGESSAEAKKWKGGGRE